MKSLNLCLTIFSIFIFPATTLAESSVNSNSSIDSQGLISQIESDSQENTENKPSEEVEPKIINRKESTENSEADSLESEEEPEIADEEKPSEKSEEREKVKKPTPAEIARLKKLAAADELYLAGNKSAAVKLYREAKQVWSIEKARETKEQPATFDNPSQLSPAGKVFWRNYQKGKQQGLETKTVSALKLLTNREPQFVSGHIHYAKMLHKYEREEEYKQALNRAVNLYPNEPKLLKAKMEADIAADKWLDASIMARQFALFNPDSPQAREFKLLAERYLEEYQSNLRSSITWNAIGNAIAGTVGFALTGNLFGPLSALQTTSLLLQGESAIGETSVQQIKRQIPLMENETVNEYVDEIGQKVAAASEREEFDYEFYLIMDDRLNAFALPGGKVFVNAGAIMKTDSEAELAGLLAHEVSHAALSHGFQLVTKGNLTANIVSYIPYVGNTASSLLVLNYSRGMEKQADIFGTRILVNAGYAADGVRNLMAQLHQAHQDEENAAPPAWLSSHPNSKQRIKYMERLIVDNNLNRYAYEGVARHQEIKKLVTAQWKEYEKCIEEVDDLQAARKCAGNEEETEKSEDEIEKDREKERDEADNYDDEPEIEENQESEGE